MLNLIEIHSSVLELVHAYRRTDKDFKMSSSGMQIRLKITFKIIVFTLRSDIEGERIYFNLEFSIRQQNHTSSP
jgi:hypothetical protein